MLWVSNSISEIACSSNLYPKRLLEIIISRWYSILMDSISERMVRSETFNICAKAFPVIHSALSFRISMILFCLFFNIAPPYNSLKYFLVCCIYCQTINIKYIPILLLICSDKEEEIFLTIRKYSFQYIFHLKKNPPTIPKKAEGFLLFTIFR